MTRIRCQRRSRLVEPIARPPIPCMTIWPSLPNALPIQTWPNSCSRIEKKEQPTQMASSSMPLPEISGSFVRPNPSRTEPSQNSGWTRTSVPKRRKRRSSGVGSDALRITASGSPGERNRISRRDCPRRARQKQGRSRPPQRCPCLGAWPAAAGAGRAGGAAWCAGGAAMMCRRRGVRGGVDRRRGVRGGIGPRPARHGAGPRRAGRRALASRRQRFAAPEACASHASPGRSLLARRPRAAGPSLARWLSPRRPAGRRSTGRRRHCSRCAAGGRPA